MEVYNLKEIIERNHTELTSTIERLTVQVTKTNGRVKVLELWRAGIVAVLAVVVIALPIIIEVFKK